MDKINRELKEQAVSLGLCEEWQSDWTKNKTQQELIDMYKKGIDFCFENNYPSNEYIEENVPEKLLRENSMFVGKSVIIHNPENTCVLLNCKGKISFDRFSVGDVYVKDSEVEIESSEQSKVFVTAHNSKVKLTQKGVSRMYVYPCEKTKLGCNGSVEIREKRKG